MNADSKILITGASGMVGHALVQRLRTLGDANLFLPSSKALDATNQEAVNRYFKAHNPDVVIHLAGRVGGIKANMSRPVEFMYENLQMALNVINAAHENRVRRLMFVSSSCSYPVDCAQPMKEEDVLSGRLEPTNEGYALAKIAGMKLCAYHRRQYGHDFFSLMPCNIYGYHDHFEPENSHVISALMFKMHQAKINGDPEVEVWGTGRSRREFLFVDDVADAIIHFIRHPNGDLPDLINIGSGTEQTIEELASLIQKVVDYQGTLKFNSDKPDGMLRKLLDVSRASALGWRAKVSLPDGLAKTYRWYQLQLRQSA
jgi:GDP-L-fucose synthase